MKTTGILLLVGVLVGTAACLLVFATDAVLLSFLAILFAIFLAKVSQGISNITGTPYLASLAAFVAVLVMSSVGGVWYFGSAIDKQVSESAARINDSTKKIGDWLENRPLSQQLFGRMPFGSELFPKAASQSSSRPPNTVSKESSDKQSTKPQDSASNRQDEGDGLENHPQTSNPPRVARENSAQLGAGQVGMGSVVSDSLKATGKALPAIAKAFATSFGFVLNVAFISFVGIFLAIDPKLYRTGLVSLFPEDVRNETNALLSELADVMYSWLLGRLMTMAITGLGTGIGLWLLGVPMAAMAGVVTALLTFIPNVGGALALALAALLALSQGATTVLWVVVMYAVLQLVESNVITPLIQQQRTSIPPALLLVFQLIFGVLTGFLGLIVATPFLAALLVAIRELWVNGLLQRLSRRSSE